MTKRHAPLSAHRSPSFCSSWPRLFESGRILESADCAGYDRKQHAISTTLQMH